MYQPWFCNTLSQSFSKVIINFKLNYIAYIVILLFLEKKVYSLMLEFSNELTQSLHDYSRGKITYKACPDMDGHIYKLFLPNSGSLTSTYLS